MEGGYEDADGAMRDRFGRNVVLYYVPKYRTCHDKTLTLRPVQVCIYIYTHVCVCKHAHCTR